MFDLVGAPWMPVLDGGRSREVGLRELFRRAGGLCGLAADFPTQGPALLRLLLAILLDALRPPIAGEEDLLPRTNEDWGDMFGAGGFTGARLERIESYLDRWRHRLDLFDPIWPFGQVADLRTPNGGTKPVSSLITTAATGNTVPLRWPFSEDGGPPLASGEALRWMLTAQCWDTAGIKTGAEGDPRMKAGKTMGNTTGPLGFLGVTVPIGHTLFETLMLNTPILPDGLNPRDLPYWRAETAPTVAWEEYQPAGLLTLLTWQCRRIRLIPDQDASGATVSRVVITAGDRMTGTPDMELHSAWRKVPAKGRQKQETWRPRTYPAGRAAWRSLDALLALNRVDDSGFQTSRLLEQVGELVGDYLPAPYPLRVEIVGTAYGTQNAVVEDIVHDVIPMPVAALQADSAVRSVVCAVHDQAEQLARSANNLSADLRRACGADPIPWDKGQRLGDIVLHELDPLVRRFLAGIGRATNDDLRDRGQRAWEQLAYRTVLRAVEPTLRAVPQTAFLGREETIKGKQGFFRAPTAELNFRAHVRKILRISSKT